MSIVVYAFLSYRYRPLSYSFFFFFNDTATTEIYTLSLHDALPIFEIFGAFLQEHGAADTALPGAVRSSQNIDARNRSEEHTSELQSPDHLVCRLLLEKKKNKSRRRRLYCLTP